MTANKPIFSKTTEKFTIIASVSSDKMKLFIEAHPNGMNPVTRDEILSVLQEGVDTRQVNLGVIDDVARLLSQGEKVEDRRIHKGTPAEPGADGKLLILVKQYTGQRESKTEEKGLSNFSELHLFDNVEKGQIVARVYPPKAGTDGVDALGTVLVSKPGKPIKPSIDKTLSIEKSDHEYEVIKAQVDGYLVEDSGKLRVSSELVVKGNVDFHFGHIDFIGKVVVRGDVMAGFNIKARDGIEIHGSVNGSTLISTAGDIVVKGFIYGGRDARVISARNFTATVAQEINAEIHGSIVIHKEALDCMLRTETSLEMKNGKLIGGEVLSACGVEAKQIGIETGKTTKITLCSDVETRADYGKLLVSIESHEKAMKLLELHLGPLAANPARIQLLREPHRQKMVELMRKFKDIQDSRTKLLLKKKEMLESGHPAEKLRVNYLERMCEGVEVRAGDELFSVKEEIKGPGSLDYLPQEKRFQLGELKALECAIPDADSNKGSPDGKSKK